MKKQLFLLMCVILIGFTRIGWGQLLLEDNFEYTAGTLTIQSTNWIESPIGSTDIQVSSGNLSYSGYPSSGIGNIIALDGGASGRSGVIRTYTTQSGNGVTVYTSFLLNVLSTIDMDLNSSSGDYFGSLKVLSSSIFRCALFVRQGSNSTKFQLGLGKLNTSTPSWYVSELDINTTYLIVLAYVFQSGSDAARMWVNPSLSGSEPIADIEQTTGSDALSLGEIQFRQNALSGDMQIDGVRVATTWGNSPLPVELTSFSASAKGNAVNLAWKTATEVDNYGFEIERTSLSFSQLQSEASEGGRDWAKVGFVQGAGSSNSPKEYSFSDMSVTSGAYNYRLKQIDNDGQFTYSKEVEVEIESPTAFVLEQNYPNPFNPSTTIQFSLPVAAKISIKLYDILGRELITLLEGNYSSGRQRYVFDASKLASGVYVYQLNAEADTKNSSRSTRIMTILK